jgi:hypothetical protein
VEKVVGKKLVKLTNKTTFFFFRIFYFVFLILSKNFRKQRNLLLEKLEVRDKNQLVNTKLIEAVVSIEDRRFYSHFGHDIFSIIRAGLNNILNKRIQGASTIEQQLIRTLLEKREITFKRKMTEILLSTELSNKLNKKEIISLYLNNYVFSKNIIGIEELCKAENYLLTQLDPKDIYEITARFKYPNLTKTNLIRYLKRVRTIEKINNRI